MSEPQTGVELRLAVARALGLKPPEGPEWIRLLSGEEWARTVARPDGSLAVEHWPLDYDTDTNRALKAWKQASAHDPDARLDISVWADGDVCAMVVGNAVFHALSRDFAVAEAICGALVAWWQSRQSEAALGATATSDTTVRMPPRREYEADLTIMPCGHSRSAIVGSDDPNYCGMCEEDAAT